MNSALSSSIEQTTVGKGCSGPENVTCEVCAKGREIVLQVVERTNYWMGRGVARISSLTELIDLHGCCHCATLSFGKRFRPVGFPAHRFLGFLVQTAFLGPHVLLPTQLPGPSATGNRQPNGHPHSFRPVGDQPWQYRKCDVGGGRAVEKIEQGAVGSHQDFGHFRL